LHSQRSQYPDYTIIATLKERIIIVAFDVTRQDKNFVMNMIIIPEKGDLCFIILTNNILKRSKTGIMKIASEMAGITSAGFIGVLCRFISRNLIRRMPAGNCYIDPVSPKKSIFLLKTLYQKKAASEPNVKKPGQPKKFIIQNEHIRMLLIQSSPLLMQVRYTIN
jgi:hypothetical protein